MTTFLDVWDNEKTCNFRVVFREAGISEQTVHKFASLFWSSAMLARDELDAERFLDSRNEEGERD